MDSIPGMAQVYRSVRTFGRCGLYMVIKKKPQSLPEIKCTSSYPKSLTVLEYSLYQLKLGRRDFWRYK
jgi:hypothetical protein